MRFGSTCRHHQAVTRPLRCPGWWFCVVGVSNTLVSLVAFALPVVTLTTFALSRQIVFRDLPSLAADGPTART